MSSITGKVDATVVLGTYKGAQYQPYVIYDSPLTITATGNVTPTAFYGETIGANAIYSDLSGAVLTNEGTVAGSAGISAGSGGINNSFYAFQGGAGIDGFGTAITNGGTVIGGAGGSGTGNILSMFYAGKGGAGIDLTDGSLDNTNTITGGAGGALAATQRGSRLAGVGGAGVYGGTITNSSGVITGGAGGEYSDGRGLTPATGGTGGVGVQGFVTNEALIRGGSGGYLDSASSIYSTVAGTGGTGVFGAGVNHGTIVGGLGGNTSSLSGRGGTGGTGVDVGGTLNNFTSITGGAGGHGTSGTAGGNGGRGAYVGLGETLINYGTVSGGAGGNSVNSLGGNGGVGVYIEGGTVIDSGTIAGGRYGHSVSGGSGVSGYAVQFRETPQNIAVGTLKVEAGAVFTGAISDFTKGETVDITNLTPTQIESTYFNAATDTLTTPQDGTLVFTHINPRFKFEFIADGSGGTNIELTRAACFRRGTRIRVARGEAAIESLRIGDAVMTMSGVLRPIRWIGVRRYSALVAAGNPDLLPIRIRAGALAERVPRRDLWVSPEHALWIEGMLIPARDLVNGLSIVQDDTVAELTYLHLEFDTHEVIYAEGAPAESFADDESRQMFDNAADYALLYPEAVCTPARFCAPRVEEGWELHTVRRTLAARASRGTRRAPRLRRRSA